MNNITGQKELESCLHPGRFVVPGTNALGKEERERGSSNHRYFAMSAEIAEVSALPGEHVCVAAQAFNFSEVCKLSSQLP